MCFAAFFRFFFGCWFVRRRSLSDLGRFRGGLYNRLIYRCFRDDGCFLSLSHNDLIVFLDLIRFVDCFDLSDIVRGKEFFRDRDRRFYDRGICTFFTSIFDLDISRAAFGSDLFAFDDRVGDS